MSVTVLETELGEQSASSDVLLRAWQDMDVPDGWRAEVIDHGVLVVPPPSHAHNLVADQLNDALVPAKPAGTGIFQTLGVHIERLDKVYMPDLVIMPRVVVRETKAPVPASETLLCVEITSKDNADNDRTKKLSGYAYGQVPLYLLIDAWYQNGPSVTLYEQPHDGGYGQTTTVPFGKSIALPPPFDLELDTSEYPPPQEWK